MASMMERLKQLKRIMEGNGAKLPPAVPKEVEKPAEPKKKDKVYTEDAVDKVKSRRQQEKDLLKDM